MRDMATTRVVDVIVPEIFNPYVINRSTELSALWQSGIIGTIPELEGTLTEGNVLVNMPFWKDLDGEDETLKDTEGWGLTPGKIGSAKDVSTQLFRGRAWASSDLAAAMAGDDPMRAIGDLVAGYWTRREQAALISVLKGILIGTGATLKNTHVYDISVNTGTPAETNKIGSAAIVTAFSKLGDAYDKLTGMIMHSVPYFRLVNQQLIEYIADAEGRLTIPTYLGKRVVVDDGMPTIGSGEAMQYVTVLFGQGAIGHVEGSPKVPTEVDRDSLGGVDVLVNRKNFILHPRGVKFTQSAVVDLTPTNAELANNTNWQKVYNDKDIRLVALITNG